MKISIEAERYADTLFFNQSRIIYEDAKQALRDHKFTSFDDTAQKDYLLQREAATKMAAARMESYVNAYEAEGEDIEHEDVIEFIQKAKEIIDRQSRMIPTMSGGTITIVRNQWSAEYMEQMLRLFRDEAFNRLDPKINEISLKSKETELKKSLRKKMNKRDNLFRWIFNECQGRQYKSAYLPKFLESQSDWTEKELGNASDYLAGEELIEQKDDSGLLVWLTHKGVKAGDSPSEVDSSNSTPFVPHTQNINTFHGPVGAVQQGNQNVANVSQRFGSDMGEVADLIKQLREHIIAEHQESGLEYIDALEEELTKDAPKESRIRLFLNGVGSVATEVGKAIVGELTKELLLGG